MPHEVKDIQVILVLQNGQRLPSTISAVELVEILSLEFGAPEVINKNTGIKISLSTARDILRSKQDAHTVPPPNPLDNRAVIFFKTGQSSFNDGIASPAYQIAVVDKSFLGSTVDVLVKDTNGKQLFKNNLKLLSNIQQESVTFLDNRDRIDGTIQLMLSGQPFSKSISFTLLANRLPDPVNKSNSFEVIFLNNAPFNFSSNVSLPDFERLVQESKKDIRWRLRGQPVTIAPSFTFEQVIRTIDGILKQIDDKNGNGNGVDPIPGERDLFRTGIIALLVGGLVLGIRGDKR